MEVLSSRVIVHPSDPAASRLFYEEALGLHRFREWGPADEPTGVVYFLGGGFLELSSGAPAERPAGVALWVQVPDLAASEARALAAGAVVERSAGRMPWGLDECWLRDPDGLSIHLVEVPADHPLRRR